MPPLNVFSSSCKAELAFPLYDAIHCPLARLKTAFSNKDVRLKLPRDIISFHEHIAEITQTVLAHSTSLQSKWMDVLKSLHNRRIMRIGFGPIQFDCSTAIKILQTGKLPKVVLSELDKGDSSEVKKTLSVIVKAEDEVFGTCLSTGFHERLLASPSSRCLVGKDEEGKIVGFVWGFVLQSEGKKVFHTFALARKVEMAKMGVASLLANEGIKKIENDKMADAISLNVLKGNTKALEMFKKLGFKSDLSDADQKKLPLNAKVFMFINLKGNTVPVHSTNVNAAMRAFIIKSIGYPLLILYELIRQITLLWKRIIY